MTTGGRGAARESRGFAESVGATTGRGFAERRAQFRLALGERFDYHLPPLLRESLRRVSIIQWADRA